MNLAWKDIAHQKLRFLATAAGLGLLFAIVLAMGGIYQGMIDDATILVDAAGGDLWLVQRDTRGPFAERSVVAMNLEERARVVPGVAWSRAFTTTTIQRTHAGKPLRATIVGVAWPDPPAVRLETGRQLALSHGELIADASLGLKLGERLELGDDVYRVVGTTRGVLASSGDGVIYVTNSDCARIQVYQPPEAVRLAREARATQIDELPLAVGASLRRQVGDDDVASALLAQPMVQAVVVKVLPGHSADEVRQRFEAWSDVTVWSTDEQRQLLLKGVVDKARRQIGLFRGLLAVVSGILVALIIYSMTAAKTREISLLKLMGARTQVVVAMVLQQSMMLTGIGYVFALGVAAVAFPVFPRRVVVTQTDLIIGAAGVVVLAIISSAMAIVRALRIPPTTILSG
jgi:putative ABC transport system permease protein